MVEQPSNIRILEWEEGGEKYKLTVHLSTPLDQLKTIGEVIGKNYCPFKETKKFDIEFKKNLETGVQEADLKLNEYKIPRDFNAFLYTGAKEVYRKITLSLDFFKEFDPEYLEKV